MKIFQLGARLHTCAGYVRQGTRLADVGTDHALLPIWLLLTGKVLSAVASDVREGPLKSAQENAEKYGVTDRLFTRLSDGLANILPREAEDVVIAGMGGELIARLVSETAWLKQPEKRLILQPMTAAAKLRRSLSDMGFSLLSEDAVKDGDKLYSVILAAYTGSSTLTPLEEYMGKIQPGTPQAAEYAGKAAASLEKQAMGLIHAGNQEAAAEKQRLADLVRQMYGGIKCES